ncbi:hypothetical protein Y1Q_0021775 [Alligator mississippiensis]|uniref:Uncharacterized protein n=1 Tax=Alligator mississippiensis TaxID=8496 RepID=A0A151PB27_ALLMI|nr:hypothetical protein Y1Q_0021775 [Alligator mississippiensis]
MITFAEKPLYTEKYANKYANKSSYLLYIAHSSSDVTPRFPPPIGHSCGSHYPHSIPPANQRGVVALRHLRNPRLTVTRSRRRANQRPRNGPAAASGGGPFRSGATKLGCLCWEGLLLCRRCCCRRLAGFGSRRRSGEGRLIIEYSREAV